MISISFSASLKLKPIPEELRMQGPFFTFTVALCVFQDNQESFGKRLLFSIVPNNGFLVFKEKTQESNEVVGILLGVLEC